ncbi:MAG: hypothetical protein CMG00_06070 [Candidatus Marinimicrobia bacterium]|nr:hypothetical protein [Candidatus Neomarinimicrobiota bacterium]|tara:strand:+ start:834 stop:1025 length:192 start_codon:yes stop_codon:yes gene_type:complete
MSLKKKEKDIVKAGLGAFVIICIVCLLGLQFIHPQLSYIWCLGCGMVCSGLEKELYKYISKKK